MRSVELHTAPVMTTAEFRRVTTLLHEFSGIYLQDNKRALVRARLLKRLRTLGLKSFQEYLERVESDRSGAEFMELVDLLTTNKTEFFRGQSHFRFIRKVVLPEAVNRDIRWWSAGCSTGEEPVSCAITWLEESAGKQPPGVRILATDLAGSALERASSGEYREESLDGIPAGIRTRYFRKLRPGQYSVREEVLKMIAYRRLNLMDRWPMKGPFQMIMCRNVMIYFDRNTQAELVTRFADLLEPGGYLMVGHSESVTGYSENLRQVESAVYQKM